VTLIPAAQYVRASTERQQYSIEYQSKVISRHAVEKGFEIVRRSIQLSVHGKRSNHSR
jgi:DNA invertase Pin-like site-specific DNA recombinase